MNVLGHHYFAHQKRRKISQIARQAKSSSNQNGFHDSSEVRPHPEKGVGSTAGAMADGSPAAEGGPAVAKRQKTAGG
jgi:hypothetical protein